MYEDTLEDAKQLGVERVVGPLEEKGMALGFPYSSGIQGSKLSHMRELRVRHEGRPYRILYAFDPARVAFLLIGGDKTVDSRRCDTNISRAEVVYTRHLKELKQDKRFDRPHKE